MARNFNREDDMGTRADFYMGRGESAEWLGSIAWDGYPPGIGGGLLAVTTETAWREGVTAFLAKREDATKPEDGWPWPWEDSRTTDYAYAFDGDRVWASGFGGAWFEAVHEEPEGDSPKVAVFPDMTKRQRVAYGRRSGTIIADALTVHREPLQ